MKFSLLIFVCSFAFANYLASASNSLESQRYESSQRLWYPREIIRQEEANRLLFKKYPLTKNQATKLRNNKQSLSVGLKSPSMLNHLQWIPLNNSANNIVTNDDDEEYEKRSDLGARRNLQFAYMISPLSEQILEIGAQKDGISSWPLQLKESVMKSSKSQSDQNEEENDDCQTLKSVLLIQRDEVDKLTGQLVRNCKGLIQVNRCEGSCVSYVQPSIKSLSGLKKECSCCNESSFRRIQVRLLECFWALDGRRILASENPLKSFMDIDLDEPIECKCRRCESLV